VAQKSLAVGQCRYFKSFYYCVIQEAMIFSATAYFFMSHTGTT